MDEGRRAPLSGRLLAVASTGGHLNELQQLLPRLSPAPDEVEWVTFDTVQSRSQLAGERVHFVPLTRTRDLRGIAANIRPAVRLLRDRRPDVVVSTGSGVAVSFLPAARALGREAHYIESATRLSGPSTSGRIVAAVPGTRTYTQEPAWAGGRWLYRGSVLDGFAPSTSAAPPEAIRSVVVVLGTNPYGFRRLLERLVAILPANVTAIWQTGVTDTAGLPIEARELVPADELHSAMAEADVVIAHAGMGAAVAALEQGRVPLLVPRRPDRDEQVDDHQLHLGRLLAERRLAITCDADDLDLGVLLHAGSLRAGQTADPPAFFLA